MFCDRNIPEYVRICFEYAKDTEGFEYALEQYLNMLNMSEHAWSKT